MRRHHIEQIRVRGEDRALPRSVRRIRAVAPGDRLLACRAESETRMLPSEVSELLEFEVQGAEDFAARGEVRRGYELLIMALQRVESTQDGGEGSGDELAQSYREALADYESRHGSVSS
jgi:hypothetical protein